MLHLDFERAEPYLLQPATEVLYFALSGKDKVTRIASIKRRETRKGGDTTKF